MSEIITELRPRLYRIMLGRYQAYLWRDDDTATLIDAGPAGSGPLIADAMRHIGLDPSCLAQVVLTHFHDDHAGSAAELAAWGDVKIIAHEADAPFVRGERPGPPPNFTDFERELHAQVAAGLPAAPPSRVDHEVSDGDLLEFGDGARVLSIPGHTDGSIALHLPSHGVLFTGDTIAEHMGQVIPGVFNLDPAQLANSATRLADLDVEVACYGHGEPSLNDASARLREVAEQ